MGLLVTSRKPDRTTENGASPDSQRCSNVCRKDVNNSGPGNRNRKISLRTPKLPKITVTYLVSSIYTIIAVVYTLPQPLGRKNYASSGKETQGST